MTTKTMTAASTLRAAERAHAEAEGLPSGTIEQARAKLDKAQAALRAAENAAAVAHDELGETERAYTAKASDAGWKSRQGAHEAVQRVEVVRDHAEAGVRAATARVAELEIEANRAKYNELEVRASIRGALDRARPHLVALGKLFKQATVELHELDRLVADQNAAAFDANELARSLELDAHHDKVRLGDALLPLRRVLHQIEQADRAAVRVFEALSPVTDDGEKSLKVHGFQLDAPTLASLQKSCGVEAAHSN